MRVRQKENEKFIALYAQQHDKMPRLPTGSASGASIFCAQSFHAFSRFRRVSRKPMRWMEARS